MNELIPNAARWLSDYYLLATIVLAVVLLVGKLVAQPAQRLAVHWSAAVGLLLLAGLCVMPHWSVVHLYSAPLESPTGEIDQQAPPLAADTTVPPSDLPMQQPVFTEQYEGTAISQVTTSAIAIDYGVLLFSFVALGSLVVLLWLVLGIWQVRRLRSRACPAPAELVALLSRLAAGGKVPRLGVVSGLPVAVAVGLRRPMVLLPLTLVEKSGPGPAHLLTMQTVLVHELAHIRQRDLWLLALLRGLLLVLWPHPLYWLWRRSVRLDQETLADAAAAEVTGRSDYAEQLVAWAREATEVRTPRLASSVGLWESPSQLRRRVAILLDEKLTVWRECSRRWRVGSVVGLSLLALGLSLVTLEPAEQLLAEEKIESKQASPDESEAFVVAPVGPATPPAEAEEEMNSVTVLEVYSPPADEALATDANGPKKINPADDQSVNSANIQKSYKELRDQRKPNTIVGLCIDENGMPQANVSVKIYRRSTMIPAGKTSATNQTQTNVDGKFRFENVINIPQVFPQGIPDDNEPTETQVITTIGRAEGFASTMDSDIVRAIAKRGKVIVWVMKKAEMLRGRITDEQGRPVAVARVSAGTAGTFASDIENYFSAMTNAQGEYVIDDLPAYDAAAVKRQMAEAMRADPKTMSTWAARPMPIIATHPSYAAKRANIQAIPGEINLQLTLGCTITGQVSFPSGEDQPAPLDNGIVYLQRNMNQPNVGESSGYFQHQSLSTMLDAKGRYRFESLPAGNYHLKARVDGWVTTGIENVAAKGGETTLAPDIAMTRGGKVRLLLVDDLTGEPLTFDQPTKAYVNPKKFPEERIWSGSTKIIEFSKNGQGEVRLAPGKYSLFVSLPGKGEEPDRITASYAEIDSPDDLEKLPKHLVEAGKNIDLTIRMRASKPAMASVVFQGVQHQATKQRLNLFR